MRRGGACRMLGCLLDRWAGVGGQLEGRGFAQLEELQVGAGAGWAAVESLPPLSWLGWWRGAGGGWATLA